MADVKTLAREGEVVEMDLENWSNKDNYDFHANIPIDLLKEYAVMGGLDTCCDVEILLPYINKASSILEIGAGYGRVLEYLLKIGFQGKITAIERSPQYCEVLRKNFSHRVDIKEVDVMDFETEEKFDLILFMWSGFAEFNKGEQKRLIGKLSNHLSSNGIIIFDTLAPKDHILNIVYKQESLKYVKTIYANLYAYCPSNNEIESYLYKSQKRLELLLYLTNNMRRRQHYFICR